MTTKHSQHLTDIAKYLNVPLGKISKNDQLYARISNNKKTIGILNIIFSLVKDSKSNLGGLEITEEALIHQWLEFGIIYASDGNSKQNNQTLLKNLNNILTTKTYLVGQRLTIADVFLYYSLLNIMETLPNFEKENYINVSRWFDNIQQDPSLRQNYNLIDFSTIYLSNGLGKHRV
ncbi:hypothetical protein ABEB36_008089 [Hypothenemus hampei]|uniref:GST C-terminal domain-containing protein n=1 Tax=Hypothenemus hampei TaxID=57062 RepID=A0ABD1EKP4_HYPHA